MELLGNFHPKVIHFAIALLIVYPLLEIIAVVFKKDGYSKAAHLILFLGVLGALASMITGKQAFEMFDEWNKTTDKLLETHEHYASFTIWTFAAILIAKTFLAVKKINKLQFNVILIVMALIGNYFVYRTGEAGGEMVHVHGQGTKYKIEAEEKMLNMDDSIMTLEDSISVLNEKIEELKAGKK